MVTVKQSKLALQDQDLLAQDQAVAVVSQQTRGQDVQRTEQYRQHMPEHGDGMTAGRAAVDLW